jgi:hypothetical protein
VLAWCVSSVSAEITEIACGMSITVCARFWAVTTISSTVDTFDFGSASAAKAGAWIIRAPMALEISRVVRLSFIPNSPSLTRADGPGETFPSAARWGSARVLPGARPLA